MNTYASKSWDGHDALVMYKPSNLLCRPIHIAELISNYWSSFQLNSFCQKLSGTSTPKRIALSVKSLLFNIFSVFNFALMKPVNGLKLKLKFKNIWLLPIYSFGHTYIIFCQVQYHTYIIHTCQATSNISGSPIESQWGLLKDRGQPNRYNCGHIQGYKRVNTLHTKF